MESTDVTVNFACQRCCQPLRLHTTFDSINEQIVSELTANCAQSNQLTPSKEKHSESAKILKPNNRVIYKVIPQLRLADSGSNGNGKGFFILGDSTSSLQSSEGANGGKTNDRGLQTVAKQTATASRLFDILSDQSDVDHPLCEECADFVIDQMDQQLKLLEDESREYREYLDNLKKDSENDDGSDLEILREKLNEMQTEERQLIEELEAIEKEQIEVNKELNQQKDDLQQLYNDEDKYWHEYNNLKSAMFAADDEQQSVNNQLNSAKQQLDKLKRTDVFNATFHIWNNGRFGTINNFRLGRLPDTPVEWEEINAAWGQTVLLLHSLAKRVNVTFKKYKLVPYGNHSFIESLENKTRELPLYSTGGFKFLWNTKFDQGMCAFLECLQQFNEEVEKGESGMSFPYRMDKGKIEDVKSGESYSIRAVDESIEVHAYELKVGDRLGFFEVSKIGLFLQATK